MKHFLRGNELIYMLAVLMSINKAVGGLGRILFFAEILARLYVPRLSLVRVPRGRAAA